MAPVFIDRTILIEPWSSQTDDLTNLFMSLSSQVLSIVRIRQTHYASLKIRKRILLISGIINILLVIQPCTGFSTSPPFQDATS